MQLGFKGAALGVALLSLLSAPVAAQTILVSSTFNSGNDGWTVGDFLTATGSTAPTFLATGGNPGGFIQTTDLFSFNSFHAPASFLGNMSAAYGGSLHLDEHLADSDGLPASLVILSNGSLSLQFRAAPPTTGVWDSFDIPLVASAGWQLSTNGNTAGAPATELQLQQVLGSLTFFHINADWKTGQDLIGLDNVIITVPSTTAPEPGSIALLASGLLPLAGIALRRRRAA